MKIQLNNIQYEYLKQHLSNQSEDALTHIIRAGNTTNTLDIDEDTADKLRDWAGERLQEVGFDINYDLTHEGEILEQLVDLLIV